MTAVLEETLRLSGSVSLRPEPFGAMAYDFRTRRLSFMKSLALVAVVEQLADAPTVADALAAAGVEEQQYPRYLRALEDLADSGILCRPQDPTARPTSGAPA